MKTVAALGQLIRSGSVPVIGFVVSAALLAIVLWNADTEAMRMALSRATAPALLLVMVALFASSFLGTWRLKLLARDVGVEVSFSKTLAAVCMGQLAGAAFFQIVGQLLMRGALLKRSGMSVSASVLVTVYERLMALFVSVGLALAGAVSIFGLFGIDLQHGGSDFVKLIVGGIAVVSGGAALAWGPTMKAVWGRIELAVFSRLARNLLITIAIQFCTMAAFIATAKTFAPEIPLIKVAAASTIVMFATALPISMAGWGVREMTSVFALGAIGFASSSALLVALLVGMLSMLTNGLLALAASAMDGRGAAVIPSSGEHSDRSALLLGWTLPILAATAVFFQIHVPVGSRDLNVNMADPVVLLGASIFLVHWIPRWPTWRLETLNLYVALMTAVMVAAFLYGLSIIGWTQWAAVNKMVGWGFLLCYGMTGALIVKVADGNGLGVFLKTIAAVAATLIAIELVFDAGRLVGLTFLGPMVRATGFAGDPNAFAFQVIVGFCVALAAQDKWPPARWIIALAVVGLWLSGSRSGMISFATVCCVCALLSPRHLRAAAPYLVLGFVGACIASIVIHYIGPMFVDVAGNGLPASPVFREERPHSTNEHIETVLAGFQQFLSSPIFGNGLGYFMETYGRVHNITHPIDSTAVWLLAEFGLIGFAAFVVPFTRVFVGEWGKAKAGDHTARVLVLVLTAFAAMSMFYELLYQRIFWIMLGALLAYRASPGPKKA